MKPLKIDVSHLKDIPYRFGGTNPREGVDCRWASREALELIFPDFEGDEFPLSADEEEVMLTRIREGETRWHKIAESAAGARKLGDVIQGRDDEGGAYVAVLVDQVGLLAITANPARGVHLRPLRSLGGAEAVFRRARVA